MGNNRANIPPKILRATLLMYGQRIGIGGSADPPMLAIKGSGSGSAILFSEGSGSAILVLRIGQ